MERNLMLAMLTIVGMAVAATLVCALGMVFDPYAKYSVVLFWNAVGITAGGIIGNLVGRRFA